ncbi:MAG: hypothetical protein ACOY4I_07770 [Bacillota bacterium]
MRELTPFLRFVSERIMAVGRAVPGCGAVRYESYTAEHSRLYEQWLFLNTSTGVYKNKLKS